MSAIRPILMSARMVRALIAGKKTQTRRALKLPKWADPDKEIEFSGADSTPRACSKVSGCYADLPCPYGAPGDLLWVRETFAEVGNVDPPWVLYRANGYENECKRHRFDNPPPESEQRWRPAIFMPLRISRITLRITDVRVQRLQEISEADVLAEGCTVDFLSREYNTPWSLMPTLHHAYRVVWESINGHGSWDENPFVWCIGFEVLQKNVDEVIS